ncbi:MAG: hypothetical protein ABFD75_15330 [Smithella sp.]
MKTAPEMEIQISILVDPTNPQAIIRDAEQIFRYSYRNADFNHINNAFMLTKILYDGNLPGYLACGVEYHDFAHVAAVFAATSRLLDGCELTGIKLGATLAGEVLIAALLHDTGYIRKEGDNSGTGAQYTKVHVARSAAFVMLEAETFGLTPESAERISRLILGTDLERPWETISFQSEKERIAAEILAAADIMGQMADRVYLEKLKFLYYEFSEAGIEGFDSTIDMLKKTIGFYDYVKERLHVTLGRVSSRTKEHFHTRYFVARDLYDEAITNQMTYLRSIIADDGIDFPKRLRRTQGLGRDRETGENYLLEASFH